MNVDSFSLPDYVPAQIAAYQGDQLITQEVCRFDPLAAASALQPDQRIMAIDIGGDKLRHAIYTIGSGSFVMEEEEVFRSAGGADYLPCLERLAAEASARNLPVGISVAIKLDGSRAKRTVNLAPFQAALSQKYDANFRNLFPQLAFVANDTIAGICGASTLLALREPAPESIAFIICASGLGGSVIDGTSAIHVEVGHVPLANELNPLAQATACGVEGRSWVCVERVTAARAGIENLYRRLTGDSLDGVALSRRYEAGDALATALYQTSALALAHTIAGVIKRFAFPSDGSGVIVLHGGNFEIASYRARVQRYLDRIPEARCRMVFSRDLSGNVCLDGAAIGAAYYRRN